MVCVRGFPCLLLALAAVPSVLATPFSNTDGVALLERQGNAASSGSAGSASSDPSNDPSSASASLGVTSTPPMTSASPTADSISSASPTTNSPSNSPTDSPSNSPTTAAGPTSSPNGPSSTENHSPTTSSPSQITSSPAAGTTSVFTATAADGQLSTLYLVNTVYTTTGGVSIFAAQTLASVTADPAAATSTAPSNNHSDTGSHTNTALIGGLVGGLVGGAVLIGAIGFVIWRVWGKNRKHREEDDGLMDDTYGTSEVKTGVPANKSASPFTNNLEQYHAAGPAQNF